MNKSYRIVRAILAGLFRILYPYRVVRAPQETKGAIYCANHIFLFDPAFLAFAQKKRQIHYMAKAELFKNKFFSALFYSFGAFPVSRGKGDTHAVRTANDLLDQGKIVGIFPEGTRSKTGELGNGKPGVAMLAFQQQVPIIPFAICCRTPHPKLFRRVLIVCGEPIMPTELGIENGTGPEYRNATRMIMRRIAELQFEGRELLGVKLPEQADGAGEHA